jgi:primase-polymerase (primpol)-like protein
MTVLPRWVRWEANTKRPLTVTGRPASSTNPATWSPFDQATAATVGAGLGLVLDGDGLVCIDLDGCIAADGQLTERAAAIVATAGATYIEVSPSGRGLHIWGYGQVRRGRRRRGVEVYGTGRYITVTGQPWATAPTVLGDISAAISMALGAA